MAIGIPEYCLLSLARELNLIPQHPEILEIGEANWYGDVPLEQLKNDLIKNWTGVCEDLYAIEKQIESEEANKTVIGSFDIVKYFYSSLCEYTELVSIDPNGTKDAIRVNVNYPVELGVNKHL